MVTFRIRFLYARVSFHFDKLIFSLFLLYTNLLSLADLREESATKGMRTAFHPQAAVKNIEQYAQA